MQKQILIHTHFPLFQHSFLATNYIVPTLFYQISLSRYFFIDEYSSLTLFFFILSVR